MECLPCVPGGVVGVDIGVCCTISHDPPTNIHFVVEDHCLGIMHPHW